MRTESPLESITLFSLSAGVLGGAALIVTQTLALRAPMIYLPYAAIVVLTGAWLRIEKVGPFARRWALSLGPFMVATIVLYLYIGLRSSHSLLIISIWGHAWRLGLMLAIGSVISAAVAVLTAPPISDARLTAGT